MLPNQLRLIIAILLVLLVLNLIRTLQKKLNEPSQIPLVEVGKIYTCEVGRVKNCHIECFEIHTATSMVIKPKNCENLKGLKKGRTVTFKVLNNTYNSDGSINVLILKGGSD